MCEVIIVSSPLLSGLNVFLADVRAVVTLGGPGSALSVVMVMVSTGSPSPQQLQELGARGRASTCTSISPFTT